MPFAQQPTAAHVPAPDPPCAHAAVHQRMDMSDISAMDETEPYRVRLYRPSAAQAAAGPMLLLLQHGSAIGSLQHLGTLHLSSIAGAEALDMRQPQ